MPNWSEPYMTTQQMMDTVTVEKGEPMSDTKTYYIEAFPYAVQYGSIKIPKDVKEKDIRKWISDHWNEIVFGDVPDFDYENCDFDWYEHFS